MTASVTAIIALGDWWPKTVNYEIVRGNPIWRLGLVLLAVLVAMAAGRIAQFAINSYAVRLERKKGVSATRVQQANSAQPSTSSRLISRCSIVAFLL